MTTEHSQAPLMNLVPDGLPALSETHSSGGASHGGPGRRNVGALAPVRPPLPSHDVVEDALVQREGVASATLAAIEAIVRLCLEDLLSGAWDEALRLADDGLRICEVHDYPELRWPLWLTHGVIAAQRGDTGRSVRASHDLERWAVTRGLRRVQLYAHYVRSLTAQARGHHEEAFLQLSLLTVPSTFSTHLPLGWWACIDLVECALRTGRKSDATSYVAMMDAVGSTTLSPRVGLLTGCAAALVAPSGLSTELFERSLALPGVDRWPFDVARVELVYGEHLRRTRSVSMARKHLTVAADGFDRLGARPWLSRAAMELRATGTGQRDGAPSSPQPLTPQELEVAELAASGLTNKEIAARVYISHRTVGAHLYRVFPKLGISSRAALRDALSAMTAAP